MSVSATVSTLRTLPFPSADRRFPTWRWVSSGSVAGDAGAGIAQVVMEVGLTPAGILSGLVFGIAQVMARVTLTGGGPVGLVAANFVLTERQEESQVISVPLVTVDTGGDTLSIRENLRILLGRASTPSTTPTLTMTFATNVNSADHRVYVEGFLWRPIAAIGGGPLFPGDFPTP